VGEGVGRDESSVHQHTLREQRSGGCEGKGHGRRAALLRFTRAAAASLVLAAGAEPRPAVAGAAAALPNEPVDPATSPLIQGACVRATFPHCFCLDLRA
jgi:hypothetical protein